MTFQFQQGDSVFHRIDPLSKFIWLVCISSLSLFYENLLGQAILFITITLTGIYWAQLPLYRLWKSIRFAFWFGIPYFILQLIFVSGHTELLNIGNFVLTKEALYYAGAISLRLLSLVLASFLFIATTDPRDIVLILSQKLYVPYRFAYGISIALRFLPILQSEASLIRAAQKLRGQDEAIGLRNKLFWYKRFALKVFISAVRRVEETAIVMETKGFGIHQNRTYRKIITIPAMGIVLSIFSIVVSLFILIYF